MKNATKEFLYWLLEKIEGQRVERVEIGHKVTFDLTRVVPKNGKWYHVSLTASCWMNVPKEGNGTKMEVDNATVWINGRERHARTEVESTFKELKY
jgi:hypothetical protein